jgi:hypothetical protein
MGFFFLLPRGLRLRLQSLEEGEKSSGECPPPDSDLFDRDEFEEN